jgi:hypothetical protein
MRRERVKREFEKGKEKVELEVKRET